MSGRGGIWVLAGAVAVASGLGAVGRVRAAPVPAPLATIESRAEDILDAVPKAAWGEVRAALGAIQLAWVQYRPQAVQDGIARDRQTAVQAALARLARAVRSQAPRDALHAANALAGAATEISAAYHPAVPADIGRLDVCERQIALEAADGNWAGAEQGLRQLETVWRRVRPGILEHGGQAPAAEFDTSLTAQQQAFGVHDAAALTAETSRGLDVVDALEQVYRPVAIDTQ
jgi:hypothetical protein